MHMNRHTRTAGLFLIYLFYGLTACVPEAILPQDDTYDSCCGQQQLDTTLAGQRIFIPNAITPNGDGRNDVFGVYSNDQLRIVRLEINHEKEILGTVKNQIPVDSFTGIWIPRNVSNRPVFGAYEYQMQVRLANRDTVMLTGSFCAFDCTDIAAQDSSYRHCIFSQLPDVEPVPIEDFNLCDY